LSTGKKLLGQKQESGQAQGQWRKAYERGFFLQKEKENGQSQKKSTSQCREGGKRGSTAFGLKMERGRTSSYENLERKGRGKVYSLGKRASGGGAWRAGKKIKNDQRRKRGEGKVPPMFGPGGKKKNWPKRGKGRAKELRRRWDSTP